MKHIYILHVDDKIAAFYPHKDNPTCEFAGNETFIEFIVKLRQQHPDSQMRCIRNEGIEEFIRQKIRLEQLVQNNSLLNHQQYRYY